jgi:FtsZ-interacting cell division protein YlmF
MLQFAEADAQSVSQRSLVDRLLKGQAVLLSGKPAAELIDHLSGVVTALNGSGEKVATDLYFFAPRQVNALVSLELKTFRDAQHISERLMSQDFGLLLLDCRPADLGMEKRSLNYFCGIIEVVGGRHRALSSRQHLFFSSDIVFTGDP